ncbi:MAG: glycosyl hydrolase 53 family protein [Verrucomicrobiota bacterium]
MIKYLFVITSLGFLLEPRFAVSAEYSAKPDYFLKGGDISMLPKFEELGAVYEENEEPNDALVIMMRNGCNCFRLRLFVNPIGKNAVVQDLDYVVKLAKRVKRAGASIILDIHYSDTWADPGQQCKPNAWKDLSFSELESIVERYSANVISRMRDAGSLPEYVQVGNEINRGFLWPDGKWSKSENGWQDFTTLLKAGIRGVKQPLQATEAVQIMIHIATGGSAEKTAFFFSNIQKHQVEYDMIALSYYPWHHGTIEDLKANLQTTAKTFEKEIVVVETAYPWHSGEPLANLEFPESPQGQKEYLETLLETVKTTPNSLGKGVLWWYPESILTKGLYVWKGGRLALFNDEDQRLPALDAFRK